MIKKFYTVGDKFLNDSLCGTPVEYVLVSTEYNKFNLVSTCDWGRVFCDPIIGEHGQVPYHTMAKRLEDRFIGVGDTLYPVKEPTVSWRDLNIGDFFIITHPNRDYKTEPIRVKTSNNCFKTLCSYATTLSGLVIFNVFKQQNSSCELKRVKVIYYFTLLEENE